LKIHLSFQVLLYTLRSLINGEGGKFLKVNRRGDPNKKAGCTHFSKIMIGELLTKGEGSLIFLTLLPWLMKEA
tara:strand:+ start:2541 stop:2759 length:219 start_codon:yes stop_codon:yes gene_type:complete